MNDYKNNGILSRNTRKEKDTHPDFSGSCEIGDPPVQFWISAWTKEGKPGSKMAGKKFFSLAFKPKDQPAEQRAATPANAPAKPTAPVADDMSDIPF